MLGKSVFLSLIVLVLNGCVAKKDLSIYDSAKAHMVETQKLRLLMRELDLVVYDRLKSELERDNIRRRYALRLAEVLKDLSFKIENLSDNELGDVVTKKDLQLFRTYSKKLYSNSEDIYNIAQRYELEKLPAKLDEMQANCVSCHSHFRDQK